MKNYFLLLFLFLSLFQSNDLKSFQYDKYFNRKKLAIGIGSLLALPVLYYLYNRGKKDKKNTKPEAMLDSEIKFYNQKRDAQNIKNFIKSRDTRIFIEEDWRNNIQTRIEALTLQNYLTLHRCRCKILFKENNIDGCIVYGKEQLQKQPYVNIYLLIAKSDISAERLLNDIVADNKEIVFIDTYDWQKDNDSIAWLTKNDFTNPKSGYYSKKIQ